MLVQPERLTVELLSDTTFGRGEGTPGEVDVEVEHDALGLPLLRGKVLHGLLRDAWLSMSTCFSNLVEPAREVLGLEGDLTEKSILRAGDAVLPDDVQAWAAYSINREISKHPLRPDQVLRTLTDIRRQTAQSRVSGAPEETTLRASRVVLRGTVFRGPLTWLVTPGANHRKVLALCALGVRHGGLHRNRGLGFIRMTLDDDLVRTRRMAGIEEAVK
jgi:hypothetical protein